MEWDWGQELLLCSEFTMRSERGFSFVELLVVVTIIAVISGIAMVSYQSTNKNARDSKRKADIEQVRSALEICRAETRSYPASITFGGSLTCSGQTYLNPVPLDPKNGQTGFGYTYTQLSTTEYQLCALTMEAAGATSPYCVTQP